MKNITLLMLMTLVLSIGMISATSLSIANSTGTVKITLDSTGKINASSTIAENGVLLSNTYLALAGGTLTGNIVMTNNNVSAKYFIGNGSQLTDVVATVATNGVNIAGENVTSGTIAFARLPTLTNTHTLAYQNITGVPTCTAGQYVKMNATGWICETITIASNSVVIAGENVTSGTIAFARLPSLVNMTTLYYGNITGVPVCTAGQVVTMNATGWICVASAATSLTNVAYYNNTQTWALDQVYTNDINVTSDIQLLSATASIKRGTTNITIDNTNNVIITLGA